MTPAWDTITRGLHKHGGGPLPRLAFDEDCLTNSAARKGITRARNLGLVGLHGVRSHARWYLTPFGRDWCAGLVKVEVAAPKPAEPVEDAQRRIDRLVADSHEAAEACAKLTKRQREVLVLLAKGFTYQEIANMLSIRRSAVDAHASRLLRVIGCVRSIEAAVLAAKAGLV